MVDCLTQVDRWRHSVSDVVEYVTTEKVTRIYFPVLIRQWEIQTQWVYTAWLFLMLKLSSWKKEWTYLIAFINWGFLTGCLSAIINRTRAFLKFKMAARQRNTSLTLYLKSELLSWPLHSVKRKPLLAQLSNCHNNRRKNVYSVLPCLRQMNRHFFYISIDTAYNRFPYMTVLVKRWFITIFNANVNMSRVLLRLVWNC
jgi:hypothetical protein